MMQQYKTGSPALMCPFCCLHCTYRPSGQKNSCSAGQSSSWNAELFSFRFNKTWKTCKVLHASWKLNSPQFPVKFHHSIHSSEQAISVAMFNIALYNLSWLITIIFYKKDAPLCTNSTITCSSEIISDHSALLPAHIDPAHKEWPVSSYWERSSWLFSCASVCFIW